MPFNDTDISNTKPLGNSAPVIELLGHPRYYQGYVYGFQQPCIRCRLSIRQLHPTALGDVTQALASRLGMSEGDVVSPASDVVQFLLYWVKTLLVKANQPVLEEGRCQRFSRNPGEFMLLQPTLNFSTTAGVINYLAELVEIGDAGGVNAITERLEASFEDSLKNWSATGLKGFNPVHFLHAAKELNIPWMRLMNNIFQFGWGANARWLDSSLTDKTPSLSTRLARDKFSAANVLRINGLPVPEHGLAQNEAQALEIAEKLGFPVVVKPADLDGGKGVKANLQNAEAVKVAFANAFKASRRVLVEKHVPGSDYRIQIVNGDIQGVLERRPGGVLGNGVDSVRSLLERQNEERKTAVDDRRHLHQMAFDDEAGEQLAALGMDWNSVPEAGRFIRLRGAANVAGGGVPTEIPVAEIHPDNAVLALRAVRALRLDVAGVDLLIPDIRHSWHTSGAYICEVNAMPQMFTTMHLPMLRTLFEGGEGRIPVIVVIENQRGDEDFAPLLHRTILARGVTSGLTQGARVMIGQDCVTEKNSGSFSGARLLCHDSAVEALVIGVSDEEVIAKGWPVDRCDLLLLDTGNPPVVKGVRQYSLEEWIAFSSMLAPKRLMMDSGEEKALARARTVFKPEQMQVFPPLKTLAEKQALVSRIVDQLLPGRA